MDYWKEILIIWQQEVIIFTLKPDRRKNSQKIGNIHTIDILGNKFPATFLKICVYDMKTYIYMVSVEVTCKR